MPKIDTLEDLLESPYYPRDSAKLEAAKAIIAKVLPKKLKAKKRIPKRVVADAEWLQGLLTEDRWRKTKGVDAIVAAALLYFLSPGDGIPDRTQVIGFLDDEHVIDLAIRSIQIGIAR
jgi:uncharacterized membrane protein YkvA (DUF1232 family)